MPLWKRNSLVIMETAFYLQFFLWPHPLTHLSNLSYTLVRLNFFKLPLSRSFLSKKPLPPYCLWQQIQTPGSGFQKFYLFGSTCSTFFPVPLLPCLCSLQISCLHFSYWNPTCPSQTLLGNHFLTEVFPGLSNTYWTYSLPLMWAHVCHLVGM